MRWIAFILTVIAIILLIWLYRYFSKRALEKSMERDKPTHFLRRGDEDGRPVPARNRALEVEQEANPGADAPAKTSIPASKAAPAAPQAPKTTKSPKPRVAKKPATRKPAAASKTAAVTKTDVPIAGQPEKMAKPAMPDDLKLISGIGPVIEKKLNGLGVWTFAQIASWKKAERDWVNGYLAFKGRIEREEWVKQAKALAKK